MRKIFALLAVAVVAVAANVASAAPVAWYNPINGGIYFQNDHTGALANASVISTAGNFKAASDLLSIGSSVKDDSELPFAFTYLGLPQGQSFAGSIVKPNTPVSDLKFEYRLNSLLEPLVQGVVVEIPEPATLAMAGLGLIGIVAAARRKA